MNIGLAIDECRKLKGITKSRLAEGADLSLSYLSQIISGKRDPSISSIEKIALFLGIPSSLLIFIASEDSELSNISQEMKSELRTITKALIKESSETSFNSEIFG